MPAHFLEWELIAQNPQGYRDKMVATAVRWSHPQELWKFYEQAGYPVKHVEDVRCIPLTLREACASHLRQHYRWCITAEMGMSTLSGPLAPVIGIPILTVILFKWSIDMGWIYGHDLERLSIQKWIAARVIRHVNQVIWEGQSSLRPWSWQRGVRIAGHLLLMGWGQELKWADKVMAKIRSELRAAARG
ncbi:hypothetical protein [Sulfobacillus thermosulfidooxidans]|uniref:hypothetical protein n=1 Tax=Sulfobacillus thermosulfidooxidans TaxID=28034 RepID=UPI0006B61473|nr:hypothetical protein [Sulfobacillus thermosulfidooxidans]